MRKTFSYLREDAHAAMPRQEQQWLQQQIMLQQGKTQHTFEIAHNHMHPHNHTIMSPSFTAGYGSCVCVAIHAGSNGWTIHTHTNSCIHICIHTSCSPHKAMHGYIHGDIRTENMICTHEHMYPHTSKEIPHRPKPYMAISMLASHPLCIFHPSKCVGS